MSRSKTVSRLPKYADDFIPTVEKSNRGAVVMNLLAGAMSIIAIFAILRFFGII